MRVPRVTIRGLTRSTTTKNPFTAPKTTPLIRIRIKLPEIGKPIFVIKTIPILLVRNAIDPTDISICPDRITIPIPQDITMRGTAACSI
jgi:hypothetical protein